MLPKIKKLLAVIPRQQFLYYNKRDFINLIISCYEQVLEFMNFINKFIDDLNKGEYKGDKGDKGKSAYEVAVEKGYTGTEEEWLESLKAYKTIYEYVEDAYSESSIIAQSVTLSTDVCNIALTEESIALRKNGTISNPNFSEIVINNDGVKIKSNNNTLLLGSNLTYGGKTILDDRSLKTFNNESIVGDGNIIVPVAQTSYDDYAEGKYIYSNNWVNGGNNDKVVPSIKSAIEQHGGKLKLRWWLWGDNNTGKVWGNEVPIANSLADGAMSKEDKIKLDSLIKYNYYTENLDTAQAWIRIRKDNNISEISVSSTSIYITNYILGTSAKTTSLSIRGEGVFINNNRILTATDLNDLQTRLFHYSEQTHAATIIVDDKEPDVPFVNSTAIYNITPTEISFKIISRGRGNIDFVINSGGGYINEQKIVTEDVVKELTVKDYQLRYKLNRAKLDAEYARVVSASHDIAVRQVTTGSGTQVREIGEDFESISSPIMQETDTYQLLSTGNFRQYGRIVGSGSYIKDVCSLDRLFSKECSRFKVEYQALMNKLTSIDYADLQLAKSLCSGFEGSPIARINYILPTMNCLGATGLFYGDNNSVSTNKNLVYFAGMDCSSLLETYNKRPGWGSNPYHPFIAMFGNSYTDENNYCSQLRNLPIFRNLHHTLDAMHTDQRTGFANLAHIFQVEGGTDYQSDDVIDRQIIDFMDSLGEGLYYTKNIPDDKGSSIGQRSYIAFHPNVYDKIQERMINNIEVGLAIMYAMNEKNWVFTRQTGNPSYNQYLHPEEIWQV